jgi:hypothetical protein
METFLKTCASIMALSVVVLVIYYFNEIGYRSGYRDGSQDVRNVYYEMKEKK